MSVTIYFLIAGLNNKYSFKKLCVRELMSQNGGEHMS